MRCRVCRTPMRKVLREGKQTGKYVCPVCDMVPGKCPICGKPLRTPKAEQCMYCHSSWRETISEPQKKTAPTISRVKYFRIDREEDLSEIVGIIPETYLGEQFLMIYSFYNLEEDFAHEDIVRSSEYYFMGTENKDTLLIKKVENYKRLHDDHFTREYDLKASMKDLRMPITLVGTATQKVPLKIELLQRVSYNILYTKLAMELHEVVIENDLILEKD